MMLLVDIVLIGLCASVLYFLLRMRRALLCFGTDRAQFKMLVEEFSTHITRAEHALKGLKNSGSQNLSEIEQASKKALNLHDDLEFLMHRAEEIADRLETLSHGAHKKIHPKKAKKIPSPAPHQTDDPVETLQGLR